MNDSPKNEKIAVLWTSADRDVALNMVFMYSLNSRLRGWWNKVTLIVWGPSAKLLATDNELQQRLEDMKAANVELLACKACADNYGVADDLENLGVKVMYMGEPFTRLLKDNCTVITI